MTRSRADRSFRRIALGWIVLTIGATLFVGAFLGFGLHNRFDGWVQTDGTVQDRARSEPDGSVTSVAYALDGQDHVGVLRTDEPVGSTVRVEVPPDGAFAVLRRPDSTGQVVAGWAAGMVGLPVAAFGGWLLWQGVREQRRRMTAEIFPHGHP